MGGRTPYLRRFHDPVALISRRSPVRPPRARRRSDPGPVLRRCQWSGDRLRLRSDISSSPPRRKFRCEGETGDGRSNVISWRPGLSHVASGGRLHHPGGPEREGGGLIPSHSRNRCTREALRPTIECYYLKTSRRHPAWGARNKAVGKQRPPWRHSTILTTPLDVSPAVILGIVPTASLILGSPGDPTVIWTPVFPKRPSPALLGRPPNFSTTGDDAFLWPREEETQKRGRVDQRHTRRPPPKSNVTSAEAIRRMALAHPRRNPTTGVVLPFSTPTQAQKGFVPLTASPIRPTVAVGFGSSPSVSIECLMS